MTGLDRLSDRDVPDWRDPSIAAGESAKVLTASEVCRGKNPRSLYFRLARKTKRSFKTLSMRSLRLPLVCVLGIYLLLEDAVNKPNES